MMPRALRAADQLRLSENQLFLALSIVVGILAGLAAVLFHLSIERTTRVFFGLSPSAVRLLLVPAVVSLVTGILLLKVFPDVRGSGVPQTEAAFHLNGGVIHPRVPLGKFLMGVLTIGAGHSLGREGPSVQIGAGLASAIGQWFRLSPERVKELVPVGAAGALSAAFNTPVAAVIFALEEIIGDLNASLLGSTVVASVASVVVARSILGNEPLFHVPDYHLVHPAELMAYAALGLAGGLVSLVFCKGLLGLRASFARLPAWSRALHPAVGGVFVGGLLVGVPQIMGVGYESVDRALNGGLAFRTLLLLGVMKLVATIASYSSGNAGGVFAPTLFMGAMAGGALGTIVNQVAPFPTGDPGAYALVGMGALFAGIIRAPMTSVFMIFEITQDYQILVPLMVANLLSFVISRRYQPTPIYHALLLQDGVHLPATSRRTERGRWRAGQVMRETALPIVPVEAAVAQALATAHESGSTACLVGTRDEIVGLVVLDRLAEAAGAGRGSEPVGPLAEALPAHAHPDHPIDVVFERLGQSGGLLPVLSRQNVRRLEGVISSEDIARFFQNQGPRGRPG
jgi:CIC family chloride channel protein